MSHALFQGLPDLNPAWLLRLRTVQPTPPPQLLRSKISPWRKSSRSHGSRHHFERQAARRPRRRASFFFFANCRASCSRQWLASGQCPCQSLRSYTCSEKCNHAKRTLLWEICRSRPLSVRLLGLPTAQWQASLAPASSCVRRDS